jgi:predicted  nucleic acid-binding Zn-ribbon protein
MSKTADTITDDSSSDRSNDFLDELGAILADCGAEAARVEALEDAFDAAVEARVDERVADLEATAADLESDIDRLRAEAEAVRGEFESLRRSTERDLAEVGQDIEDLEEEVEALDEKRYYNLQDIADIELRLDDLEEWQDSIDDSGVTGDDQLRLDDLTELERMELLGVEEVLDANQGGKTAERALTIANHLEEWGQKTPKGLVIRCSDHNLRHLLGAERNETLAWKQVHRACQKVVAGAEGAVAFLDTDRHGRVLCLHEDTGLYERIANGDSPLTASSAENGQRAVSV